MIKIKNINKHVICCCITILFLFLAFFYFKYAYLRIFESFNDFYSSLKYYLNELFGFDLKGEITINNFTSQPFEMPFNLPSSWEEFKALWKTYWKMWITWENVKLYFSQLFNYIYYISRYIIVFMPFIMVLIFFNNKQIKINNDYNKDSMALIQYKKIIKKVFIPIKEWIISFIEFLKENSFYLKLWIFIWCYNFNFIAIIIEVIAYYLYFIAGFNISSIYIQIVKLFVDLSVVINFIPGIIWMIILLLIINFYRRKIGFSKLNHMEFKNRGFINERPIVLMVVGTMGSKKTTTITDIALSEEIMLRDKAFEKILENDLKFPSFP